MNPRATSEEYHDFEQLDLFGSTSSAAATVHPGRGCRHRRPYPQLSMNADTLEEIVTAAIPQGLVERFAKRLAGEVENPLGGVAREVHKGLGRAYKARLLQDARNSSPSFRSMNEHVTHILDERGNVEDIGVSLHEDMTVRVQIRIASDIEEAMEQARVYAHELLAEWVLMAAGLEKLDDGVAITRENEPEVRRRIRDGMFDAFTASEVSPESVRKFAEAISEIHLDAVGIGNISTSDIEVLIGIRDEEEIRPARLPEPVGDHRQTASAMLHVQVRDAVAQGRFGKNEISMFPTADISRRSRDGGGIRGSAQLLPPGYEKGRITPDQAQAWAGFLFQQATEMCDLDADMLDALWMIWLHQSGGDPKQAAVVKIDDLLRMRGVAEKVSGDGRTGGYRPEQRKEVVAALHRLEALWIDVGEMDVYETPHGGGKPRKKRLSVQSRAVVMTSRAGLKIERDMDVDYIRFRPGDVFAKVLSGSGRQVAWLSMAALSYDYYRDITPKRLAKYLAVQFRVNARHGYMKPLKVSTLLEAIGENPHTSRPLRLRERLENALDKLHADGVIAGWQYEDFVDRLQESRKGWLDKWLESKVAIEPPEPIKDFYRNLAKGGSGKMDILPPPDPTAMLAETMKRDPMGEKIRARRRERGISQYQLAERMDVTQATISKAEAGKEKVSAENRRKLQRWLDETAPAPAPGDTE